MDLAIRRSIDGATSSCRSAAIAPVQQPRATSLGRDHFAVPIRERMAGGGEFAVQVRAGRLPTGRLQAREPVRLWAFVSRGCWAILQYGGAVC
jgi:hypothetical protein